MHVEINTSSPQPIYRQIVEQVRRGVARGALSAGEALPSVRELAQRLVVNPNTVYRAYAELERAGVVRTERGVGTFVAEHPQVAPPRERRRALAEGIDRILTDAVHLGVSERELLEIVRERARPFVLRAPTPVQREQ